MNKKDKIIAKMEQELEYLRIRDNILSQALDTAHKILKEQLKNCGHIVIDGKCAAYQDLVGVLLMNGYGVEVIPVQDGSKLEITIKKGVNVYGR